MKVGIGVIVKNEEKDLPSCLDSFLPYVDCACILDTGSTDKTMQVAESALFRHKKKFRLDHFFEANDEQGRITDFSMARNAYIKILESMDVDYIISADADDILLNGSELRELLEKEPADFYSVKYRMNPNCFFISYKIWRARLGTRYKGRVHETLQVNFKMKVVHSPIEVQHVFSSIPGQETGTERNMRILRSEIYPPLRSLFYWANENVDAKNYNEAIKWYLEYIRRVKEGEDSWWFEYAHCYWRAARWINFLGDPDRAESLCKELLELDPSWSEAWCELAYIEKTRGNIDQAKQYALKALSNQFTPRLFSEMDKYTSTPSKYLMEQL